MDKAIYTPLYNMILKFNSKSSLISLIVNLKQKTDSKFEDESKRSKEMQETTIKSSCMMRIMASGQKAKKTTTTTNR